MIIIIITSFWETGCYRMSLENFCNEMNFANAGFIHDSFDQDLRPEYYNPAAFWKRITGLKRIEGNNRLNKETLIAMNFIKPHPPANITFELQLNVPLCLIILPNPSRTNTEVEDNLMYIGDNLQVHEEHNDIEEEGANLHHNYDASEQYNENNNQWVWMQTEVERISTEQQRQGVEISGLRNDVQRGNRVNDENN